MEFNLLHEVTNKLNIPLYTCNTYALWKGTNENFNGLIRRFLPKKTDFCQNLNNDNINLILEKNNKMPCKIFGL